MTDGIPHRRDDGELVGWIVASGEEWDAVDVLGRPAASGVDWLAAEEALEEVGLGFLADVWMLEGEEAEPLRVRILEVTPSSGDETGRIVVKIDDFGALGGPLPRTFALPWPLPERLRPMRTGDPDGRTL